ncbi:hypothetical protein PAAG_04074 [Paracoccidioides lutzii Pb01]|uniref:Uncharacterized protein n=1 Tax=Paracoccidioides lutzii (strain ATCC MYA-826 / Pb01) TaxID=502779 RepID=C1GZY0_PARBA|nr:hypothetical protein PAAG_04074 [Paracoccidioides lutzii Pb01]EEH33021.2 hypothetical protein PAAG_04074 [Paracoccidioides lutzii Pb01]
MAFRMLVSMQSVLPSGGKGNRYPFNYKCTPFIDSVKIFSESKELLEAGINASCTKVKSLRKPVVDLVSRSKAILKLYGFYFTQWELASLATIGLS